MERTQATAWLLLLLLLSALVNPGARSEMCRSWMFGLMRRGFGPFRCPGKGDFSVSKFCCGTCLQPYCCPWRDLRLNQTACLTSGVFDGLTFKDLMAIPTAPPVRLTTPPTVASATTPTSPTTLAVLNEKVQHSYVPFVLLALFTAASIGGAYWLVHHYLNQRFINEGLRRPAEELPALEMVQVSPPSDDEKDLPPKTTTTEVPHCPEFAVDTKARSPSVENIQGSCEILPCLDKPVGEQPSHPSSETLQRETNYLVVNNSPTTVEDSDLEPAMEAESSSSE